MAESTEMAKINSSAESAESLNDKVTSAKKAAVDFLMNVIGYECKSVYDWEPDTYTNSDKLKACEILLRYTSENAAEMPSD